MESGKTGNRLDMAVLRSDRFVNDTGKVKDARDPCVETRQVRDRIKISQRISRRLSGSICLHFDDHNSEFPTPFEKLKCAALCRAG